MRLGTAAGVTRLRAWLLLLALAANLLLAAVPAAGDARACSCAESSPEERLQMSAAVFSGEVVDVEENFFPGPPDQNLGPVTFDVEESWKGVEENEVTVRGHGDGASCGIQFQEGRRYLVYAYRGEDGEDDPLTTGICAGTMPLRDAEADGPAETTLPENSTSETATPASAGGTWRSVAPAAVVGSTTLLLLASAGALVVRRRRR